MNTRSLLGRRAAVVTELRALTAIAADLSDEPQIAMSALMRGDAEVQWQSHKIAVETGILSTDEIREIEGWNPRGKTVPGQPLSTPTEEAN